MIDYKPLYRQIENTPLAPWLAVLPAALDQRFADMHHGDLARWQTALSQLPEIAEAVVNLSQGVDISSARPLSAQQQEDLLVGLQGLHPWRKGPFTLFGIHVDCEWRSDWKWQRIAAHIDLAGKRVLDVGCGNGYYMWRMWQAGAHMVVGVDPNLLFYHQFMAVQRYLPAAPVWQLPFTLEELPEPAGGFDSVFSMGVFYHRKSPVDHLLQLKACLRPGGELVMETLVIEGDANTCLVPEDRYAQMRNVWFLPSVAMLERLLQRSGFQQIKCIDLTSTSTEEQRSTEWMRFQSLPDFLDPTNPSLTCEGYPAPLRATFTARKPG
ncbi:tRNA 5-methoxyuridine(34)/uridine 5-oxyacetic acid(34) synthase CmoB [Halopseudomonas pelagia]|uniref:tRNA 5-methoxyuridine(34)/uridine 5-oxyacetic acid(34) synthase CmoB n=1 Tax=Halopseudomonas pelagia TaxID=553151 RepID=UPI0003A4E62A|nr:tRNA 5-methoxyuridine(34)/uridine 5-oxyacetic acid(34) synthase CmoB [Halopseudomonas pelagia]